MKRLSWYPPMPVLILAAFVRFGATQGVRAGDVSAPQQLASALWQPGVHHVAPLAGQAATNHAVLLAQLRHVPKTAGFESRTFSMGTGTSAESLRYLLFRPATNSARGPLPLVLSLHGGGPRHDFAHLLEPEAPGFAYGLGRLVCEETQREHPCWVVVPWSHQRGWDAANQRLVLGLLAALQREFSVDAQRLYVTGQSMGGAGTWSMITEHPEIFAAAVPICGAGDPARAVRAKSVAIWALHGSADALVSVEGTRGMIAPLLAAGAKPIYWEYDHATHAETAERAYCEPELIRWLFAQHRP